MPISATITPAVQSIRLSDALTVKLTIVGPAPLQVELPKELLSDESAQIWKIEPIGTPLLTQEGDLARWGQSFRLSPFLPGDEVTIGFRPVTVGFDTVPVERISVRVTTTLGSANAEDVRPVTGIEQMATRPAPSWGVGHVIVGAVVVLFISVVGVAVLKRRKKSKTISPQDWAFGQINELSIWGQSAGEVASRLTTIIRGYVFRRFGLTVDPFTTAELILAGDVHGIWNGETRLVVVSLIDEFDRVKFAGHRVTPDEPARWCSRLEKLVTDWQPVSPVIAEQ